MIVIVGAGPAGLYTAIKLAKAGVTDLVVVDPRAGSYTRPGHLKRNAFMKAEVGIGSYFWRGDSGHIKDLERNLYKKAQDLGIRIEQKSFVGFQSDTVAPSVVVTNKEGVEEHLSADYVFDCTGSKRTVVHSVNSATPDSPLKLTTMTELPATNHFLAYVKMNKSQLDNINISSANYRSSGSLGSSYVNITIFDLISLLQGSSRDLNDAQYTRSQSSTREALRFAQNIVKLRALGWNEMSLPRCYGQEFGALKNKACLYLQTPANLAEKDYDKWVQTVLECYHTPVHYEHLPASKKYPSKPRFHSFKTAAQVLDKFSFKGDGLPTVIALGDAQIDPDYFLAHGIYDGMSRIDTLFDVLKIRDGKIAEFNSAAYLSRVQLQIATHKSAIIETASHQRRIFSDSLTTAQTQFTEALRLSDSSDEKAVFQTILREIAERQRFEKAKTLFSTYFDAENHIKSKEYSNDVLMTKLQALPSELLKFINDLPESFGDIRQQALTLLVAVAAGFKDLGNAFKSGNNSKAIENYKLALDIYNLPMVENKYPFNELVLYSNLAIAYLHAKQYPEMIASEKTALEVYERCPKDDTSAALHEKIVCNLIKGLCAQAHEFLLSQNTDAARTCHEEAESLFASHAPTLRDNLYEAQSRTLIAKLGLELADSIALAFPDLVSMDETNAMSKDSSISNRIIAASPREASDTTLTASVGSVTASTNTSDSMLPNIAELTSDAGGPSIVIADPVEPSAQVVGMGMALQSFGLYATTVGPQVLSDEKPPVEKRQRIMEPKPCLTSCAVI